LKIKGEIDFTFVPDRMLYDICPINVLLGGTPWVRIIVNHLEKYNKIMADWITSVLAPHSEAIKISGTLDLPNQKVVDIIFCGFTEISDTFESLEFSKKLLSVESPRSKKIAKEKYLKFVVNTYLQDVYILKERLNTYATQIQRMHKKMGRNDLANKHIEPLYKLVKDAFQNLVDIRGGHVHARRYTDVGLSQVSSFALVAKFDSKFENPHDSSLKDSKQEWKNRIQKNNKETEKLLNEYFEELLYVVAADGEVITP
jgi:hypothetical protein